MARKKLAATPRPARHRFEELTDEAKSVLAVLALAAIWPTRFADGWVTNDGFGKFGVYLGERADRESLKAAVRRGVGQLSGLSDSLDVEPRRTRVRTEDGQSKESDRRLRGPMPVGLQLWLLGEGLQYLTPGLRQEFIATEFRPTNSFQEVMAGLEETVVRALLAQGRHDEAIARADLALAQVSATRERRALTLARVTAQLRRSQKEDWVEARTTLTQLLAIPATPLDHADRVTESRIRMALAYAEFLLGVRGREPATEELYDRVERIRELQAEATALASELSLSDRGRIADLEGLLLKWEAQVNDDEQERENLFDRAERFFRQAMTFWRLAQDSASLGVALYNLGELRFARYNLYKGAGTEDHIDEALLWYEASVEFTEALGTLQEWVLDYGKAAECIALLIPHFVDDGRIQECIQRIATARYYLDRARAIAPVDSWQARMLDRVEAVLRRNWEAQSPPLPDLPVSAKKMLPTGGEEREAE